MILSNKLKTGEGSTISLRGELLAYNRPGVTPIMLNGDHFILHHVRDDVEADVDGNITHITRWFIARQPESTDG